MANVHSTWKRQLNAPERAAMRCAGKARRRRGLHARKEEQRRQRAVALLARVRSALTGMVMGFVGPDSQHSRHIASEGQRSTAVSRFNNAKASSASRLQKRIDDARQLCGRGLGGLHGFQDEVDHALELRVVWQAAAKLSRQKRFDQDTASRMTPAGVLGIDGLHATLQSNQEVAGNQKQRLW
jgi:hypothetical protein